MKRDWIYLDYNASTPMDEEVVGAMRHCLSSQAHPSSSHPQGREASERIEESRHWVARVLGCEDEEVVFCSGSTEASNHVIKGVCFARPSPFEPIHFISSSVDHPATVEPLKFLQRLGHEVTFLPVDRRGQIDPGQVAEAMRDNTALVTLIHGQNEVGTVQPLAEVGQLCSEREVLFHVDASQSFGKVPVDVNDLKADFLNIAGHKIYGPKGVGALFIRKGRRLEPLLHGGGHEHGWRSGTPATPLIAGMGAACRLVHESGFVSEKPCQTLWRLLEGELGERVQRNGHPEHRLPNVLHLTFEGVNGRELLDNARISASTGAACHSAAVSPVLRALGFSAQEAAGSVRLSTGRHTDLVTVEKAAESLLTSYRCLTEVKA